MTSPEEQKQSRRPISCEDFLFFLREIVSNTDEKAQLSQACDLLRKGFGPDEHYRATLEEVERIGKCLLQTIDASELGFRLMTSKASRKAYLLHDLRKFLATKIRQDLSLPPASTSGNCDQLSAVIGNYVSSTKDKNALARLLKKAVIALSLEPDVVTRSNLLDDLLWKASDHRIRNFDAARSLPKVEPYTAHLLETLRIVSKRNVDFRAITIARKLRFPIEVEVQERRKLADAARRDRIEAEEGKRLAEDECSRLRKQIALLEERLEHQHVQLQDNETAIELEKQKTSEIRETLTTRHAHELEGKLRRLTKRLTLEIDEALMFLDREDPNAASALNRIREMRAILKTDMEIKT